MSEIILEVNKLAKNYGSFRAVDGISFAVPKRISVDTGQFARNEA